MMKLWYLYIGGVLATWLIVVSKLGVLTSVITEWPIALVMIMGSFVAGSTPMGGGAVSFPFLVLWQHVSPDRARDFGLMIQAVGMTSAAIYIFCRRIPVHGVLLAWTVAGAAGGMLLGTVFVAPSVPSSFVKLTFACMWMSFAVLTMAKNRALCSATGIRTISWRTAASSGLLVGVVGGIIASIIGVGVEMVLYTVLVLLYRSDLKIAVPTAVSAMAMTSIMGVATHLWLGDLPRNIVLKFAAAGPMVIFGAPLGAYIVSVVPRIRTLYFVSVLCVVQFVWMLLSLKRTGPELLFAACALCVAGAAFVLLYRQGNCATD